MFWLCNEAVLVHMYGLWGRMLDSDLQDVFLDDVVVNAEVVAVVRVDAVEDVIGGAHSQQVQ
eukprot:5288027-Amphidinium_carterae.2